MTLEELYGKTLSDDGLKAAFLAALKAGTLAEFLSAQGCGATVEETAEFLKARQEAEGELADEELDAVAGGGCNAAEEAKESTNVPPSGRIVATIMNICG